MIIKETDIVNEKRAFHSQIKAQNLLLTFAVDDVVIVVAVVVVDSSFSSPSRHQNLFPKSISATQEIFLSP